MFETVKNPLPFVTRSTSPSSPPYKGGEKLNLPLIIGVGNVTRGDDGAGIVVARMLAAKKLPGVRVREMDGEGTSLMEAWKDNRSVLIIDAVSSGATPGTIHRFNVRTKPLPAKLRCYSSHLFGVAEAVEIARTLGHLPPRLVIYGIEGRDFAYGEGLSPDVEKAVKKVVLRLTAAAQRA